MTLRSEPLTSLWNISHSDGTVPSPEAISRALATVDAENVIIDGNQVTLTTPGSAIDLGGIAKGYIADQMKAYLNSQGITSGLIDLGGNILALGPKEHQDTASYTIGIQKPFADDGDPIAAIEVTDQSVVTSGIYQRYFESDGVLYHHILDTATGYPCDNGLASVTIINNSLCGWGRSKHHLLCHGPYGRTGFRGISAGYGSYLYYHRRRAALHLRHRHRHPLSGSFVIKRPIHKPRNGIFVFFLNNP